MTEPHVTVTRLRFEQSRQPLGAMLGEGWLTGHLGFGGGRRNLYGDRTATALAIQFALLVNDQQRAEVGRRLAELVRGSRYRISTGFVGTPLICDALCSVGAEDVAFRLIPHLCFFSTVDVR